MSNRKFEPFQDLSETWPEFNGNNLRIPTIQKIKARLEELEKELMRMNEVFSTQFAEYCTRSTGQQIYEFCTYRAVYHIVEEELNIKLEVCYMYWRAKRGSRRTVQFEEVINRSKANGASLEVLNTYIGIELQRIEIFKRMKPIVKEIRHLIDVVKERQSIPSLPVLPEFIEFED